MEISAYLWVLFGLVVSIVGIWLYYAPKYRILVYGKTFIPQARFTFLWIDFTVETMAYPITRTFYNLGDCEKFLRVHSEIPDLHIEVVYDYD